MAKNQAVAKIENTAVAGTISNISNDRPDWLTKGNAGSEDVSTRDMILPRVDVLQALSPQIKKSDPKYIEGAEQGQFFNTVTGQLYGDEVTFVPILFRKEYVLWRLRKAGGGFVGAFKTLEEAEQARSALQNPDDHESVESHQHFALLKTEAGWEEAVFSMTKSKLKVSRALNTLVQIAGVDRFAKAYRLNAVEADKNGESYWSYMAHPVGFVDKELYERGKGLYELIKSGAADVDRSGGDDTGPVPAAEL